MPASALIACVLSSSREVKRRPTGGASVPRFRAVSALGSSYMRVVGEIRQPGRLSRRVYPIAVMRRRTPSPASAVAAEVASSAITGACATCIVPVPADGSAAIPERTIGCDKT